MSRYIDAEALCKLARNNIDGTVDSNDIMRFPIADVKEVKHGKWTLVRNGAGVCSECHRQDHIDPLAKYCRYCGARLEAEE